MDSPLADDAGTPNVEDRSPEVITRCPWCDARIAAASRTCPACHAAVAPAATDAALPGLTTLAPTVSAVRDRGRARTHAATTPHASLVETGVRLGVTFQPTLPGGEAGTPGAAFAAPSDDVRDVMRQLAREAELAGHYRVPPGEVPAELARLIERDVRATEDALPAVG